jgi:nucleotide-binding universal stress UspA family protein
MFKTILVALDDSDLSEQVVHTLYNLHLKSDTKVILAHVIVKSADRLDVVSDRPTIETEDLSELYRDKLQFYQTGLPYQSELEVVSGDPAEEIVRLAHIYNVNLIVMGNRGLTGLNRVLQGSVSSQVVADAPCSVLVVKLT